MPVVLQHSLCYTICTV